MAKLAHLGLMAALALVASTATADDLRAGTLRIDHPWARVTPPMLKTGAIYLVIENQGQEADRLIGAETGIAQSTSLHESRLDAQGVMTMRPLEAIDVPAGGTVALEPSGRHLMLVGLGEPLREGARFPLTLDFERAGRVEVEVEVLGLGGAPAHDEHSGH